MRQVLTSLLLITWALWFGGMIALFLFVVRLFQGSRSLGVIAAPVLFQAFDLYQPIVGMIACASATLLTILTRRKAHVIFTLLMLSAFGAALIIRSWTVEIMTLDRTIPEQMARFDQLHHATTKVYVSAACLLFVAGIGLMLTLIGVSKRQTTAETAAGTDSPGAIAGRSIAS